MFSQAIVSSTWGGGEMHHGIDHMVRGGRWSCPGGQVIQVIDLPPPPPRIHTGTMVNGRAVRILLECILVSPEWF